VGRTVLDVLDTGKKIGAFALISLGTAVTRRDVARNVIHPLIRKQLVRFGVRLLPAVAFLGLALGFMIVSQTVALLSRVGATNLTGVLMVAVVVRELGPLTAALIVLARVGTATVIELGTVRATGEIEALEALGIDPIHYLVVPRLIGLVVSVIALSVYLIVIALVSGYLFGFLQNLPLSPSEYVHQIANALRWEDFVLLAFKTASFGAVLALTICFNGLAQPLRLEEISHSTTRTVAQALVGCVLLDAFFIVIYLLI
jgi:phospholipid/cholesterol/gamma-HCH transport system permease protein